MDYFQGYIYAPVVCQVCCACGHVELAVRRTVAEDGSNVVGTSELWALYSSRNAAKLPVRSDQE